jgi:hypothetical protein
MGWRVGDNDRHYMTEVFGIIDDDRDGSTRYRIPFITAHYLERMIVNRWYLVLDDTGSRHPSRAPLFRQAEDHPLGSLGLPSQFSALSLLVPRHQAAASSGGDGGRPAGAGRRSPPQP